MKSKMSAIGGSAYGGKNKVYGMLVLLLLAVPMMTSAQWNISTLNTTAKLPGGTITQIVTNILMWLLYMLGIVGVIGFVVSGIMYLIAAGDQTMIDRAKKGMTFSIVGVIVGLAGVVVIKAIDAILGGTSTTF
jgi:hypothetical protein